MPIEVEIRSFLSKEKYQELLNYFRSNTPLVKEDNQETWYYDCQEDLRIQKNSTGSKIWLKKGKMHDKHREEIEIKLPSENFNKLQSLFSALGYGVAIKWFRHRIQFDWQGIKVCLDHTKGYGYIIELEQLTDNEHKESVYEELTNCLSSLNIDITSKDEFINKYEHYKANWQNLV